MYINVGCGDNIYFFGYLLPAPNSYLVILNMGIPVKVVELTIDANMTAGIPQIKERALQNAHVNITVHARDDQLPDSASFWVV